jgi:hypothetical protein
LRDLSRRPAVSTTVECREHAGSAWGVRGIHLALATDQSVGAGILDARGAFATDSRARRRAAVVVRPAVAGAAAVAELARRTVARTWGGRRLALVGQADVLRLTAPGPARGRGIVGAADQSVVTGACRPAVTGAPLAGASREVACVLAHTVARPAGETGVVGTARQPVVAVALHAAVAAAATARAGCRRRTRRIAADRGRSAGSRPSGRTVRVIGAAKERRVATGVLRPGGTVAADTRSRWVAADLLHPGRGASRLPPQHREQTRGDPSAATPQRGATRVTPI